MDIFVVGNGPSRKDFDLNRLKGKGPVYGCNFLYEEFIPTILFSIDKPAIRKIGESQYPTKNKTVVPRLRLPASYKKNWIFRNFEAMEIAPLPSNSGALALNYACRQNPRRIFMFGFDAANKDIANTPGVISSFRNCIHGSPNIQFINVNDRVGCATKSFSYPNYKTISYADFDTEFNLLPAILEVVQPEVPDIVEEVDNSIFRERVFVFGNGASRQGFDPYKLKPYGEIWGCNAMYLDYEMDRIFCVDTVITQEILKSDYIKKNKMVIPQRMTKVKEHDNLEKAKFDVVNTAGGAAIQYACKFYNTKNIYMFGFDGVQGNVYADRHEIYKRQKNAKINWSSVANMYKQHTIQRHQDNNFINVIKKHDGVALDCKNYSCITYDEFEELLSNKFKNEGVVAE